MKKKDEIKRFVKIKHNLEHEIEELNELVVNERKEFGSYIDVLKCEIKNLETFGFKREEKIKELFASLAENTTTTQSMIDEMNVRFSDIKDMANVTIGMEMMVNND